MEIDYKIFLWIITILMVFYGYFAYIRDILKWKTKPHLFSWIIFVILDVISVLVQYNAWAWPWVWWTVATTLVAATVMILALKYWEKHIKTSDIISFILAIITVILYTQVSDPTYSMIFVLIIITLAFYPTVRKSYNKPSEETLIMYIFAWIRSFIWIFATTSISFLTIWLPVYVVLINTLFIWMVLFRKKTLKLQ